MTQTTPETTTYLVLFNGQATLPAANSAEGTSTVTLASDLNLIYTDIMAIPASRSMHPLVFGSGETLSTGIYDIAGPTTITLQENIVMNYTLKRLFKSTTRLSKRANRQKKQQLSACVLAALLSLIIS